MLQLTDRATIRRMKQTPGQAAGKQSVQAIYRNVPCLVVPISRFDVLGEFARESTHRIFLPRWCTAVKAEDELDVGRRRDAFGGVLPYRYLVAGVRRYMTFGLRHVELFAKERE